jgi:hypothetical protein
MSLPPRRDDVAGGSETWHQVMDLIFAFSTERALAIAASKNVTPAPNGLGLR